MPVKSTGRKTKKEEAKVKKLTTVHLSEIEEDFKNYSLPDKKKILSALGVGSEYYTCQYCEGVKKQDDFYVSTDFVNKSGKATICRRCVEKIVYMTDGNGKRQTPTKSSVCKALEYLDKPFLEILWDASIAESENNKNDKNAGKLKGDVWSCYIKNIQMPQYNGFRYSNSDIFTNSISESNNVGEIVNSTSEIMNMYSQNKKDAIRLLGYDPFQKEVETEKPFLYATLIGYLDASPDANEDRMRVSSIVEIVKGFNHIEKINDLISGLISDTSHMGNNVSTIKALENTKKEITASLLNLARDNGISLKHSVNGSKGENTLTGMSKKLKDIKLRDDEVNGFDIGTCKGMRQVADISHASIIKQINLDENDYSQMVIEQKEMIEKLQRECSEWKERARILLRENIDLKDYMKEQGLLNDEMMDTETILTQSEEVRIDG